MIDSQTFDLARERSYGIFEAPNHRAFDAGGIGFFLCCAYVLSQVYMVPLWTAGPSWSVWPTLTDMVVALIVVWLPFMRRLETPGITFLYLRRLVLVLVMGCLISYALFTLDPFELRVAESFNDKGPSVGLYQIYRLVQFAAVFWLATGIKLTSSRRTWLRRCIAITFWMSCALILANYFELIDTATLSPQIPRDLSIAGPWAFYARGVLGKAVGAISFHHAYPTVQLLLLAATYLALAPSGRVLLPTCVLSCLWLCSLVGGSRAGFVGVCTFVAAMIAARPRKLLLMTFVIATFSVSYYYFSETFAEAFSGAVERQESITTSYDQDGFAGRVEIWNERLGLLNRNPLFWLTGTGFGSAIESGSNGHMLYLQTTLECGLVGTIAFLFVTWKFLAALWGSGAGGRTLFFATGALLVSALTQETFYPVPALGHFCGMYLFCAAMALALPSRKTVEVQ